MNGREQAAKDTGDNLRILVSNHRRVRYDGRVLAVLHRTDFGQAVLGRTRSRDRNRHLRAKSEH